MIGSVNEGSLRIQIRTQTSAQTTTVRRKRDTIVNIALSFESGEMYF